MDFGLQDKTALVGGASKGLGLATARALAAEGAHVILVSRSADHLAEAASTFPDPGRVRTHPADLADPRAVKDLVEAVDGTVDILVCNTGGPPPGGSFDHDDETWQKAHNLLLFSVKRLVEAYLPGMRERRWGRILAITSRTVKEPSGMLALSNIYRSAVTSYLKGVSRDVAADGVTVNTLLPGAFHTERFQQLINTLAERRGAAPERIEEELLAALPQKRFGRPEEFAAAAVFLASAQASAVTGAAIPVDGGALHGLLS